MDLGKSSKQDKEIDWKDALFIGKACGLSFFDLNELTFSELIDYANFYAQTKSGESTRTASQADIDMLAI